jgi:hypothetical protein
LTTTYKHTQSARLLNIIMAIITMTVVVLAVTFSPFLLFALLPLALTCWLFSSLTIEITDAELRWQFGPGLIRKRVPLDQIASAEQVRTNFWEGWGIHISRFGWLYNVSGWDAVAIKLQNGKRFALGTDEPQALAAALPQSLPD